MRCQHLAAASNPEFEVCDGCSEILKSPDRWFFSKNEIDELHLYWHSKGLAVPPMPTNPAWTAEYIAHLLALRAGLHRTISESTYNDDSKNQLLALLAEHDSWSLMFRLFVIVWPAAIYRNSDWYWDAVVINWAELCKQHFGYTGSI